MVLAGNFELDVLFLLLRFPLAVKYYIRKTCSKDDILAI